MSSIARLVSVLSLLFILGIVVAQDTERSCYDLGFFERADCEATCDGNGCESFNFPTYRSEPCYQCLNYGEARSCPVLVVSEQYADDVVSDPYYTDNEVCTDDCHCASIPTTCISDTEYSRYRCMGCSAAYDTYNEYRGVGTSGNCADGERPGACTLLTYVTCPSNTRCVDTGDIGARCEPVMQNSTLAEMNDTYATTITRASFSTKIVLAISILVLLSVIVMIRLVRSRHV